jgi:hypothetical protein
MWIAVLVIHHLYAFHSWDILVGGNFVQGTHHPRKKFGDTSSWHPFSGYNALFPYICLHLLGYCKLFSKLPLVHNVSTNWTSTVYLHAAYLDFLHPLPYDDYALRTFLRSTYFLLVHVLRVWHALYYTVCTIIFFTYTVHYSMSIQVFSDFCYVPKAFPLSSAFPSPPFFSTIFCLIARG